MTINIFPMLILLAGWCFFDREGLGAASLALAIISIITGVDNESTNKQ